MCVFFIDNFGIYLLNSHRDYGFWFNTYREKCYIVKRVIDFFLERGGDTEDDLLAYLLVGTFSANKKKLLF